MSRAWPTAHRPHRAPFTTTASAVPAPCPRTSPPLPRPVAAPPHTAGQADQRQTRHPSRPRNVLCQSAGSTTSPPTDPPSLRNPLPRSTSEDARLSSGLPTIWPAGPLPISPRRPNVCMWLSPGQRPTAAGHYPLHLPHRPRRTRRPRTVSGGLCSAPSSLPPPAETWQPLAPRPPGLLRRPRPRSS